MKSLVAILLICIVSQVTPAYAEVCENGLCIKDTSGSGDWQLNGDWMEDGGGITYKILGYDDNRSADIDKIRHDTHFDIPVSTVYSYNINETTISGWPAVLGVINGYMKGYIYVSDYKIGITGDVRELSRITITAEPGLNLALRDFDGKPFPKDHLEKEQAECEADCEADYNESQLECGSGKCGDKRYYNSCLADCQEWAYNDHQYELENDIQYRPLIKSVKPGFADVYIDVGAFSSTYIQGYGSHILGRDKYGFIQKPKLDVGDLKMTFLKNDSTISEDIMELTKGISASPDIAYFNVTETTIGGWPAVVRVQNLTRIYTSGRSDSPLISVNAIIHIHVNDVKILAVTSGMQDGYHKLYGIEVSEKKMLEDMKSIKITLASRSTPDQVQDGAV
jgi:hypothetical protein